MLLNWVEAVLAASEGHRGTAATAEASHRFYRRPAGKLCSKRLRAGLDIKTPTAYVVMAPLIHPDTRRPYRRIDLPVAARPAGLLAGWSS